MKKKIYLYNHFHNGDIFFSRILVNIIKDKFDITFYHNQKTPLFIDIPEVCEINGIPSNFKYTDHFLESIKVGAINTWIGQPGYINKINGGCSFENYMELIKDICKLLEIKIENHEEYLPTVNFHNLPKYEEIKNKINNYKKIYNKLILVSNGDVHSSQAPNFDFFPIIERLSNEFPNFLFLNTKTVNLSNENIVNVYQLTETLPDLLYITQLSIDCDVIIGRASGPYCFTQIKNNLLNENKTYISFNNEINEGKFYSGLRSKFVWSNNFQYENIYNTIKNNIIN